MAQIPVQLVYEWRDKDAGFAARWDAALEEVETPNCWHTEFLQELQDTGNVSSACTAVEIHTATAYRHHKQNHSFRCKWDTILSERRNGDFEAWHRTFLDALPTLGVRAAAIKAKIPFLKAYRYRRKHPKFAAEWTRVLRPRNHQRIVKIELAKKVLPKLIPRGSRKRPCDVCARAKARYGLDPRYLRLAFRFLDGQPEHEPRKGGGHCHYWRLPETAYLSISQLKRANVGPEQDRDDRYYARSTARNTAESRRGELPRFPGHPVEVTNSTANPIPVVVVTRHELESPSRSVILFGPADEPFVLGKRKPKLTKSQYDVAKALIEAGENGLTKDEFVIKSTHEDARGILTRLRESDSDWAEVIQFAAKSGGRYRLK